MQFHERMIAGEEDEAREVMQRFIADQQPAVRPPEADANREAVREPPNEPGQGVIGVRLCTICAEVDRVRKSFSFNLDLILLIQIFRFPNAFCVIY